MPDVFVQRWNLGGRKSLFFAGEHFVALAILRRIGLAGEKLAWSTLVFCMVRPDKGGAARTHFHRVDFYN